MKRSAAVLAATILVITVLFWAGWHNLRARRLAMQQAEENHVTLTPAAGTYSEALGADGINLRGKPAPGFTLLTLEGKKVSLSDYKGRPVLVNFWGTWCVPCKEEMPWIQQFRQQHAAEGFEVLGIVEEDAPKDEITKVVNKIGVTYPILIPDKKIDDVYGVSYLPTSFYVDRKGIVVEQTIGLHPKDELEASIKKISAGGL